MKRFLIKIAYKILQHNPLETLPYLYCTVNEYKVVDIIILPITNKLIIRAERKLK